ncbi:alpha-mannosidase [Paenibacillus psychroresistens]|uniref:Alpha-mannosidase n=1 Tax=Paenibacillus psychroresistens TaxID=1778678 RepID=A0A6B8RF06_9BACL|nr:glycoside hydrolase family 38 C-terminal domain-containing protein [Paenibacillus psychroresistens]QGQ94018.1 alpha-mannosidase [Paenibacillus psychroresistens]
MPQQKTVHIISHSHWDREWYMPFEKHRMRLVTLLDTVIELLESNGNDFHYFHLDGHVLLVDDYLEIRPEMKQRLQRLIADNKLFIGPWYVLQDAFLTSGEAQLRNLQLGIERAEQLGAATRVGYFPDTFGNISQSAQLLLGFGIETAVFGRGINAIAENNTVVNEGSNGYRSELWWEAPDGSRVLSVFLANWYHNGMELPINPVAAKETVSLTVANVEKYAATSHLLLMNGCDHQPVQRDVGQAIKVLNDNLQNYRFVHSNFPDYLREIALQSTDLQSVRGELIGQQTDGNLTLVNTASARMYLKQWNAKVQLELERWSEPFSTIAWKLGAVYPEAFIDHAWKQLLENHPHDSICGCSIDEVHQEMVVRFKKANQVASELSEQALSFITNQLNTNKLVEELGIRNINDQLRAIVVFNPLGWKRDDRVEAELDCEDEKDLQHYSLLDPLGNSVAFSYEDLGWIHGFTLPLDSFRVPWKKRRYLLKFQAEQAPALGHTTYILVLREAQNLNLPAKRTQRREAQLINNRETTTFCLENEYLYVQVEKNGTLVMRDKATDQVYKDLLVFEDNGDVGNEYMYVASEDGSVFTTKGSEASIEQISSSQIRIIHHLSIPFERQAKLRSEQLVSLRLDIRISLEKGSRRLEIDVSGDNQAKDHRLRVLFPTNLVTDYCYADAPFDVVRREIWPWSGWENPSRTERMQSFVDVTDGDNGLMIASIGLPEYEILRDGHNTIALTLLRSVGELGDWNYFATPEAQCLGSFTARFAILSHTGGYVEAIPDVSAFQTPLRSVVSTLHEGSLAATASWLHLPNKSIMITSFKKTREGAHAALRFVNLSSESQEIELGGGWIKKDSQIAVARLDEKVIGQQEVLNGSVNTTIPAKKIATWLL